MTTLKRARQAVWYHAITDFDDDTRYWWNRTREELVDELVLPLVGKQVRAVKRHDRKALFNFGAISYMTILKTRSKLKRPAHGKVPPELKNRRFVQENDATEEFLDELKVLSASPESRSLLQQSLAKPLKQVFVIMRFGDADLDSAYQGAIKAVGEKFEFRVLRADEIRDAGQIAHQVLDNISRSEIVLAELSGERPNCYYEAGFAHALGKTMIFCIRQGENIHFDLTGYRFIQWRTEEDLRQKLREFFESYTSTEADEI
jgi:nucleoside 2-deoxyribosyltransferase